MTRLDEIAQKATDQACQPGARHSDAWRRIAEALTFGKITTAARLLSIRSADFNNPEEAHRASCLLGELFIDDLTITREAARRQASFEPHTLVSCGCRRCRTQAIVRKAFQD